MDLPLPLRRVLVILGTAITVGAIGLVIAAMRSAAPTPVHPIGQPSTGEPSQPDADPQSMLNSTARPSQPGAVSPALPNPQSAIRIPQSPAPRSLRVHVAGAARHTGV